MIDGPLAGPAVSAGRDVGPPSAANTRKAQVENTMIVKSIRLIINLAWQNVCFPIWVWT